MSTANPMVIKNPYEHISSSDHYLMTKIQAEYQRAYDADTKNRIRTYNNWRAYIALDGGQWPEKDLADLKAEERNAVQFNVIGQKVDTLAASLAAEQWDLDWKPIEGVRNSLTESIKSSWYSDSELCQFESQIGLQTRDAMVQKGVLKMVESNDHNPLLNIAFKRMMPGYVIFDPHWITDDDKDCHRAWEMFHLSAKRIADHYEVSSPLIDQAIKQWKRFGGQYEEYDPDLSLQLQLGIRGHLYRVIEYHWIEFMKTTRLIGKVIDSPHYLPFPLTKDHNKLEQFMVTNNIDPWSIEETPYTDKVHKYAAICPELTHKILDHGVSRIQPQRLPYFQLTANRGLGKDKGIVDDMMDLQETINRRESKLTDMIETSQGGGKLVNRDLFRTPLERERFKKFANDPKYIEFVDGEELTKEKAIHYLNANQYPAQIINQLERMYDVVDRVSKVPAAMEAMSESTNESGVLFNRKLQVARLTSQTIMGRMRKLRENLSEAYFWQWQISYTGPEREFSTFDGKHRTVLNEKVYDKASGKRYIKNRPDMIPRCVVICTESKNSPNQALADQALFSELYNLSAQTNPEYANLFYQKLLSTMDMDQEMTERVAEIGMLQRIRDRKRILAELANLDATEKQSLLMSLNASSQVGQILGQMGLQAPEGEVDEALVAEEEIPKEPPPEMTEEAEFTEVSAPVPEGVT